MSYQSPDPLLAAQDDLEDARHAYRRGVWWWVGSIMLTLVAVAVPTAGAVLLHLTGDEGWSVMVGLGIPVGMCLIIVAWAGMEPWRKTRATRQQVITAQRRVRDATIEAERAAEREAERILREFGG
jgi:hypothetical protein